MTTTMKTIGAEAPGTAGILPARSPYHKTNDTTPAPRDEGRARIRAMREAIPVSGKSVRIQK
ncbi:MAG: hypothetical protein LBK99_02505 [Opitutaceae bacterium]|jgi:hypothetical protein|nr:hypothetical protein [Opitutaceae bacterium]